MNGAIGAFGQAFAENLLGAARARGDYNHLPAMLFLLPQRLFQRVGIRLVDLVGNVLVNPCTGLVQLQRRVFLRNLLHADQDLQT